MTDADTEQPTVRALQHHASLADKHRGLGVSIPVAVSVFSGGQYQAPRSWTERAYPNLTYFHEVAKGGNFAAWEQPHLFADEVRAAFCSLL